MTTKAIKISEGNYNWLIGIAADLQKNIGKSVSVDEAIGHIREKDSTGNALDILKLSGAWKMNDLEAEKIKKDLRKGWSSWKTQFV